MQRDLREGLTLTRCDVCGRRQFCAVNGSAMCSDCCPGAVEAAREEAANQRRERLRAAEEDEPLPPKPGESVGDPIPFREVAHIFLR
jgi:hypothetical protein